MSDVTLSAAVRSSLLSLQGTTKLINQTQGRLSTGLKVSGAIDDPVKYFQAKSLSDRASDFSEKKDSIDQGISTLTAAIDGAQGIEDIVSQMKGLALSAKSATSAQISELVSQFNDLRTQIANLASDTTYQGLNLINGTGSTLTVNFSNDTGSVLEVKSVDISEGGRGLKIREAATAAALTGTTLNVSYDFVNNATFSKGGTITLTYAGEEDKTLTAASYSFKYGTRTLTVGVGTASGLLTFTQGKVLSAGATITLTITTRADNSGAGKIGLGGSGVKSTNKVSLGDLTGKYVVDSSFTSQINSMVNGLETALTTLRTKSQTLGSNVALLQTRLDFTTNYVNTLQSGSDKLTLADLNEEGANLLALQTRQQLGISALSFAGQAEQGILALFR